MERGHAINTVVIRIAGLMYQRVITSMITFALCGPASAAEPASSGGAVDAGHPTHQCWLNAFDNSFAVISTIGTTRSYAMRVGPITPIVPTIRPST